MVDTARVRPGWVLAVSVTVQCMVSLDMSVVNVALPSMRAELGFGPTGLQWVVNAYLLVYAGFLLLGGRLGDILGQRRALLGGLLTFGVGSLFGGLATVPWELVVARAVQGLGAAVLTPVALAVVHVTFPSGPGRARAMGWWGAAGAVGAALGVLAGGLLTEYVGWRWVLLVNVPIVVWTLAATWRSFPEIRPGRRPRLDVLGALLVTAGMALLILGVVRTADIGWGAPATAVTLGVAALLVIAFVVVETRTREPLMRLGVFGYRSVAGANVFGFMLAAGQLAGFYFISLYMQQILGYPAAVAGVAFLPFCVGIVVGVRIATKAMIRFGARAVLLVGGVAGGLGMASFGLLTPESSFVVGILAPSVVASLATGACFVAVGSAGTEGVPAEEAGMASGVLNSSRMLGGSVGLAVLVTVAATVSAGIGGGGRAALGAGYSYALVVSGALLIVGVLLALVVRQSKAVPTA
jgi:EmrB/QacA subfamily drug resistance transporter